MVTKQEEPIVEEIIPINYETATKEDLAEEIAEDYRAKKLIEIADVKKKEFYILRDNAFEALRAKQKTAMDALATKWQGYEDNDYTI